MLQLKSIVKEYASGDNAVKALKGVSLSFRNCEFVSILGPSGCGKTTMLNIIGGLDRYTSGDLIINGRSTKEFKDADWDAYRNHSIGFVFQSYNLIPHQTVLANVELALTLSGVSKAERRERAIRALERVGLSDQLDKRPNQMSGGQMQRVAIARALVNNPDILLADEPTGALDSVTSVQVMEILKEVAADRLVIMVTHNRELAEQYSTRIVSLLDGELIGDTDPYDGEREDRPQAAPKEKRLSSMSFFTALSLSFHNLLSKRTRTLLTSFAGSIGIIGIALILAMSTGINAYIDDIQRDTLSSYPIVLESEHADLSSLLTAIGAGRSSRDAVTHDKDAVYSSARLYSMMNAIFNTEVSENDLASFKAYLDREMETGSRSDDESIASYISSVHYTYDVRLNTYVADSQGKYRSTEVSSALTALMPSGAAGMDASTSYGQMSGRFSDMQIWEEILPGQNGELISELVYDQYDLIYGKWPQAPNEIVLILDENNEIPDVAFYALGVVEDEEIRDIFKAVMTQSEIHAKTHILNYEEVCSITYRLLLNGDYYADLNNDGIYESIRDDDIRMDMALRNAYELKIVGVIRPNGDAVSTVMNGYFGYTTALTAYIMEQSQKSEVLLAQQLPENENVDILTGLPFVVTEEEDLSDENKRAAFREYVSKLSAEEKTELYTEILSAAPEDEMNAAVDEYMARYESREQMEELISSTYGMDGEAIKSYLSSYDDDELREMIRESIRTMLANTYAENARQKVDDIMNTPDESELQSILDGITARLTSRETRLYYVMNDWSQNTTMSNIAILNYLQTLNDDALGQAVEAVAKKTAKQLYASMNTDGEAGYLKVAAAFDAYFEGLDDDALVEGYEKYMPSSASSSTLNDNLKKLGAFHTESPKTINIYANTFENKDRIADMIRQYNDEADEDSRIVYTDYVALLMSGITDIINAISYGLIIFVSVSLVVSSIMIGIITYISVLERTKEIGVLRSIGASKRDISLVFNAETLIVGFTAGAIGIGLSLLLCIPISLIVHALTGITTINAFLEPIACVVLVCISMVLTLIAGLIPSGMAAKLDPVNALRSE